MQYLRVVMVNGASGAAVEYRVIEDPSWQPLEPGGYFVICADQAVTVNCDHQAAPPTNLVQNGPMDAIALVFVTGDTIDVVSYGGSLPGYTEGTGTTAEDSNSIDGLSIARWPDGVDTNNNDADFRVGCSTPGAPNSVDTEACGVTTGLEEVVPPSSFMVMLDAGNDRLVLNWVGDGSAPVVFEVFNVAGSKLLEYSAGAGPSVSWYPSLAPLRGQLLLVRASSGGSQVVRRVVVP
jgi:hypothetical protein